MVFARLGDTVRVSPATAGSGIRLVCDGPFADRLGPTGKNLVWRAAEAFAARRGRADIVDIRLTKRLPVASGMGGGSANAADLGIAVFSTTHTIGVAQTVRRLLAEFPADEKLERAAALADLLNLVVTQCLVAKPHGGRTALREWLFFDDRLRLALADAPVEHWSTILTRTLEARGRTLAHAADRALEAGTISERDWRRLTRRNADDAAHGHARGDERAGDRVRTGEEQGDRRP